MPALPPELADLRIVVREGLSGLGFDLQPLMRRPPKNLRPEAPELSPLSIVPTPRQIGSALFNILGQSHDASVTQAARAFGMTARSYQRCLADQGATHAQLLRDARYTRAVDWLRDTDAPIATIAIWLGFEHTTDFSR